MSSDRDPRLGPDDEPDDEFEEDRASRSIFSATWFRVVLVVLGLAVVGAIAVPYVLDVVSPPPATTTATTSTPVAPSKAAAPTPSAPSSAAPAAPPTAAPAPTAPAAPPAVASAPKAAAPAMPPSKTPARDSDAAPKAAKAQDPEAAPKPAKAKGPDAKTRLAAKAAPAPSEPVERDTGRVSAAARRTDGAPRSGGAAKAAPGGDYFVQVGAFKEADTARRVVAKLRDQNYPADVSLKTVGGARAEAPRPAPRPAITGGGDRYDVIVSGASAGDINAKLSAKGLASEPAGEGVRIRPSLPLRDAVALSKDLGSDGFKVQVRRGGMSDEPAASSPASAPSSASGGSQTLHRVRVGGYPDRASAVAVLHELEGKGYQPFISRSGD